MEVKSNTSRRGGSRRGGRGSAQSFRSLWSRFAQEHLDPSDTHSSLFASAQATYDNMFNLKQPVPDTSFPEPPQRQINGMPIVPGYLTRDMMMQLMTNINNGFFYISQTYELIKQSQLELFHARHTLERVYRSQHGDFEYADPPVDDLASPSRAKVDEQDDDLSDTRSHVSTDNKFEKRSNPVASPPVPEYFQIKLDPFQFTNEGNESVFSAAGFHLGTGGRGGGLGRGRGSRRGGRGGGGQRRKRQPKDYFSNYDSVLSHKSIKTVLAHLNSAKSNSRSEIIDNAQPVPVVVLQDVGNMLRMKNEIKPNRYVASKIEASLRRKEARKFAKSRIKEDNSNKIAASSSGVREIDSWMGIEHSEEERQSPKNVSMITKPSANEESEETQENDVRSPMAPVTVTTQPSITATRSPNPPNPPRSPNYVHQLPQWRTLRVDPATLARIKLRVKNYLTKKYASEVQSTSSSESSSSRSTSPSIDEEVFLEPAKSSVSLDHCPNRNTHISYKSTKPGNFKNATNNIIEETSNSDHASVIATPPDEEMLDLTPYKDNCGCHNEVEIISEIKRDRIPAGEDEEKGSTEDINIAVEKSRDVKIENLNPKLEQSSEEEFSALPNGNHSELENEKDVNLTDNEENSPVSDTGCTEESEDDDGYDYDDTDNEDLFTPVKGNPRKCIS